MEAEHTFYYNLFVVALETGMRASELAGQNKNSTKMAQ